jgi:hypothetical protein
MERIMRHLALLALAGVISTPVLAGRLAEVTIVDRDTGQTLQTHWHRGEYWVAGRPGAHYAIKIQSRDHRRLLAVTSVDGVNVLTGDTASFDQRGYVFDPWVGYDIAGWRKSNSQIAAFTFTAVPKSYAARTGRPGNVGVIGVALFPEKTHHLAMELPAAPMASAADAARSEAYGSSKAAAPDHEEDLAARRAGQRRAAPSLGTGHGRREHSEVVQVAFEREQATPAEIIRIRYDSYANLVAMGVIARPVRPAPPRWPEPFPDTPQLGYVPDP